MMASRAGPIPDVSQGIPTPFTGTREVSLYSRLTKGKGTFVPFSFVILCTKSTESVSSVMRGDFFVLGTEGVIQGLWEAFHRESN
jgi:hypothetical protein